MPILLTVFVGIVIIGILVALSNAKAQKEKEEAKNAAIAEGEKAGKEGRDESDCPYKEGREPKDMPAGVLLLTDDGTDKGKRYWWIVGYRSGYRQVFEDRESPAYIEGGKAFEAGKSLDACPWNENAKHSNERISAVNWRNGFERARMSKKRGEMIDARAKEAYADGFRVGQAREEIRDIVGYLGARGFLGVMDSWKAGKNAGIASQGAGGGGRPPQSPPSAVHLELIDASIRKSLEKPPEYAITENDRDTIEKLYFKGQPISDEDLSYMKRFRALRGLYLNAARVSDEGLVHLKSMANLEELSLIETSITDRGLGYLNSMSNLRVLQLSRTRITDAGLQNLLGMPNMEQLSLIGTGITDTGLATIRPLTKMKMLFLSGTKITDAGLKHLNGFRDLEWLSLNQTQISDSGLEFLKPMTWLHRLDLCETPISDAAYKGLVAVLNNSNLMY